MTFCRRLLIPAIAVFAAALCAVAAAADEPPTIAVTLDNTPAGKMAMTLSADTTRAGAVDFGVKNASTNSLHEFLVLPWSGAITALPYDAKADQVDEDKLTGLQGLEDMKPGLEAKLRLVLPAGKYVVFCNQPGHYKAGMVRRFTVTPQAWRISYILSPP
jgi:uncharacterized cupredoxin-like copper-binding protein